MHRSPEGKKEVCTSIAFTNEELNNPLVIQESEFNLIPPEDSDLYKTNKEKYQNIKESVLMDYPVRKKYEVLIHHSEAIKI